MRVKVTSGTILGGGNVKRRSYTGVTSLRVAGCGDSWTPRGFSSSPDALIHSCVLILHNACIDVPGTSYRHYEVSCSRPYVRFRYVRLLYFTDPFETNTIASAVLSAVHCSIAV